MKIAYFDCFSGISGDMTLGALIHAGADVDALREGLASLGLHGWELRVRPVTRGGINATDVDVHVEDGSTNDERRTTNDPAHSHGHMHSHGAHGQDHIYALDHEPQHSHGHHHDPSHPHAHAHSHTQPQRGLREIRALIAGSALPATVKERATRVFQRLGEAEARIHACDVEEIHFHEVGAVDSIVDITGAVFALHLLEVERVVCSPLPMGRGFVRAAHGLLPVPAPATLELLRGLPMVPSEIEGELVTPTGAALMATLADAWGPMPPMRLAAIGYGAGKKEFATPNLLRVCLGEAAPSSRLPAPSHALAGSRELGAGSASEASLVTLIEANLDDLNPQLYGYVMERLFAAGALDVTLAPIQMKKNRPGITLGVLCEPEAVPAMAEILFTETSTLGLRTSDWQRICLDREWLEAETEYGPVRVKIGRSDGRVRVVTPEFDDCRRAAEERGVPLKEVQAAATAAARLMLRDPPP
jgi:uncharacterized protein (TIGR00299 family) protein